MDNNDSSVHVLKPGTKLQSKERVYEIVKVLGSGTFGVTYEAKSHVAVGNITTTMRFAVKEHFMSESCYRGDDGATVIAVPAAKASVATSRADFITEANRLKKLCLKSRNIVSVNETFEANGTAYYVMEFLDGGTPGKCSEEEAVSIVTQIAGALEEIHKEKVLHLDLKPDNIVLKTNDNGETYPVLIDFGISKHFDSKNRPTSSPKAKGMSSGYAPQEQYSVISEFSPKYDVYALGAVLFNLCTGKNPPDAFKISPNQRELKSELDGRVSSVVEKTILNAMRPAASERTPDIKQFCDDLNGIDFVPVLNVSESSILFNKEKGQKIVHIDSNLAWSVLSAESWCKVTKSGNEIVISISKNKERDKRICRISVIGTSHRIFQTINIEQKGQGTVVTHNGPTWWKLHSKQLYQAAGIAIACCGIAVLYILFKPDPEKESHRLSEAIANMDGVTLQEFAKKDSTRAYVPYAKILADTGDSDNAIEYARKALSTPDSVAARELLASEIKLAGTESNPQHQIAEDSNQPQTNTINSVEPDEEKYKRASETHNLPLMLSLAQSNYTKAYFPTAQMSFEEKLYNQSRLWANRAIRANINRSEAVALIKAIDNIERAQQPSTPESSTPTMNVESNDELFARASTIADFKALADKGYAKAYAPLAEKYLAARNYDGANTYARKAISANVGKKQAGEVVEKLAVIGYYDNGENGGKPNY